MTEPEWAGWPDDRLMDLRICDLNVAIEGSALEPRIEQLRTELSARGLSRFEPHFWLSAEWFSPDGVPGVAIPFYLAHPRLEKLERTEMLEVEGGTPDWCMKILRHEAGHAIDNAYRLRNRLRRQRVFGPSYMQYPDYYTPKPYSKSYVLHLDSWYAQSHPDEDFAETFAVWLTPDADWRTNVDWPAPRRLVRPRDAHDREVEKRCGPSPQARRSDAEKTCGAHTSESAALRVCAQHISMTRDLSAGCFRSPEYERNQGRHLHSPVRRDVPPGGGGVGPPYQYNHQSGDSRTGFERALRTSGTMRLRGRKIRPSSIHHPADRARETYLHSGGIASAFGRRGCSL